jgi:hypothetical protein
MHVHCSANIVRMSLGPSVTNMATVRCVKILPAIGIGGEVTSEVKGNSALLQMGDWAYGIGGEVTSEIKGNSA